ncbi:helix-turn-helix domain-containing protein [Candidatus Enterococcus ikei]|uniref:Helix-turn-helix domain-containing protein n=1 Tax=Candidatus Enterococcus ikei TaxID=2815326 RepID=A0ABS3H0Q7_9ENTE|nr:helix-turn-helix domain-containing protein [Enterococcus sp. DIV0869a]MBO0441101.1 helix-turn-helix domain-containing protein [Enterococcus sp. DIV0869a]
MRIFLDEVYDRRINVLSFVASKRQEVSLTEIAEATNLSKKTVSIIIRQFEQELNVTDEYFKVTYVHRTLQSVYANNLDLVSISNNYLKMSILYKMIRHIFLMERIDAITFCDLEFISPATFSRHRRRLQKILNQCGLNLTRSNEITGDELRIRNFFFLFFANASGNWDFETRIYNEINEYFGQRIQGWYELNSIKKSKLCLIIYICNVRFSQKKVIEKSILTDLARKFQTGTHTRVIFDYFHLKKNRSENQAWDETSAALFLLYKERLAEEENFEIEVYQNFFNEYNFPLVNYSHLLAEKLIDVFFQTNDRSTIYWHIRKEIDMMHLLMETCFIDPRMFYYIYDERSFFYADKTEQKIKIKIRKVIEQLITETEYGNFFETIKEFTAEEVLIDYTYLITYTMLVKFLQVDFPKVRILIQNSKVFVEPILSKKITLLFGNKVEFVKNQFSSPDIIVTDTKLMESDSNVKEIFIASFSNSSDFSLMLEEIRKKIIEHYTNRKPCNLE